MKKIELKINPLRTSSSLADILCFLKGFLADKYE